MVKEPLSESARGLVSALTAVVIVNLVRKGTIGEGDYWGGLVQIVVAFVVVAYTEKVPEERRSDPVSSKKED